LQKLGQGYGINYPLLKQFPIEKYAGRKPINLPMTFIISPKGKLYTTLSGMQTLANFQSIMSLPPIRYD
jgi:hypothetical protein